MWTRPTCLLVFLSACGAETLHERPRKLGPEERLDAAGDSTVGEGASDQAVWR